MLVSFGEQYLEDLYTKGKAQGKNTAINLRLSEAIKKAVKFLISAKRIEDLFPIKSLHFEAPHGDKEGRFSIKANDQYRVEFTVTNAEDDIIVSICNILELSNHYK